MKTNKKIQNGKATSHFSALLVRLESAEKIREAARSQWRLIKIEHKQARKAFKEAKKAAKSVRKEAKAAARDLRRKGFKLPKPLKPAAVSKFLAVRGGKKGLAKPAAKRNGHTSVLPHPEGGPQVPAVHLHA
jgi:predicted  nucleic acid-binding Zn-ribbon protein